MAETREKTVFLVGQPGSVDKALNDALASCGIRTHAFRSAEGCRESLSEKTCDLLLIDLDGDAAHSLDLLAELRQMLPQTPTIAFVDHGDIPTAIQAIKAGAANCFQKPVDVQLLGSEIRAALNQAGSEPEHPVSPLTPMEMTVIRHILAGKTNHETAQILHRSPRTIEVHRKNIMRKMDVVNMVDLVKASASMGFLGHLSGDTGSHCVCRSSGL